MTDKPANAMWGGRFAMSPAEIMQEINASIGFDKRLAPQDIRGSKAHAQMLAEAGILTKADAREIAKGLDQILAEIEAGTFKFSNALEDVHMNVESRLKDLIGSAAGRLHTARSRNDQVATDFRLYVRDCIDGIDVALEAVQQALAEKAEAHAATVMPGFTHLQPAQPVTFGHHLLAYVEMIGRDRGRFADARKRLNECPLGSAALAGTSFPIDRQKTAEALGFDKPMAQFARWRLRPRFRARDTCGGDDRGRAFLAAGGRDRDLDDAAVRLREALGSLHDRLVDHAAEAQPRRCRTGARQGRAHRGRLSKSRHRDEGVAARLFEGHAGGQGSDI